MRKIHLLSFVSAAIIFLSGCQKQDAYVPPTPSAENYSSKVANDWMDAFRAGVKSEGKSPPQASRIYAYAAIALYQSVLPGLQSNKSLEGQIDGLNNFPSIQTAGKLDYTICANEAMYQIYATIFGTLKPENIQLMEKLHQNYLYETYNLGLDVKTNSIDFGKAVAAAVINRANNDNFAATRSLNYVVPSTSVDPSFWSPTNSVTSPLEPYWGTLKCFTMPNGGACTIPSTIPFSTTPGSPFYNQALEVVNTTDNLTQDQKDIAFWWADAPGATATPPGHWLALASQLIREKNITLGKSAEIYTTLNIGMADAFISCWHEKYRVNLLRPVSYIRTYIPGRSNWNTLIGTPPFPEYPSGHSVSSGAAATILTNYFGNISFTDATNVNLGLNARSFNSFTEAANEAGISRLYGGIHYREAIDKGLLQGKEVSRVVFEKIKLK